ncbi:MAG: TcpQ domain-containing protein [Rhodospirillales bacterium]|nr:TcpQ domain-containing protein [Rhodospirillales bacterium]
MRSYVYGTCILAGLLLNGAVYAEPMKINPYPDIESVSEGGAAAVDSASSISVEASPPSMPLSGFRVPQPGDAYFDPPSQDDLRPVVQEQPVMMVDEIEEVVELPSEDVQDEGFVQREIAAETFYGDKPDDFGAAEPMDAQVFLGEENVSASAPIESDADAQAQAQAQAQVEGVAEPVHETEMPLMAVQKEREQPVEASPETIVWKGSRVPVHTPMVSEAVGPAPDDVLVDEVIETSQNAGLHWRAMEGQNIRQTLEQWSQDEDAEFLWENQHAFAVLEPFEIRGSYEQAVQKLLNQYQSSDVRPVATLHVNPQNQRKTLVVRVVEGG